MAQFDFDTASIAIDDRRDYGETRYIGVGYIGQRLPVVVFMSTDDGIRVLSLRKSNKREVKACETR